MGGRTQYTSDPAKTAACTASYSKDFLLEDDSDALLAIIDADILENDEDFLEQTEISLQKVTAAETSTFPCKFSDKVRVSKGGMTRHLRKKHPEADMAKSVNSSNVGEAAEILPQVFLKSFVEKGPVKLSNDECYPATVCSEFKGYQIEDISKMHDLIGSLLVSFNGDSEIFYPKFYKIFIDNSEVFKGLSHKCSMLLVTEITNLILGYITGATFIDDVPTFSYDENQFTQTEKSIITYISGYVFGTMYRRMRFSKLHNTINSVCHF